jgi:hypothetical protein
MASAPELAGSPAPASAPAQRPALLDAQGRLISYLRVSLTDRCNFRCTYCSPAETEAPGGLLTREELSRLFRLFAGLGVRRLRLTGGEPTLRRDVVEIVGDAASTPGIEDVALTTNGYRLDQLVARGGGGGGGARPPTTVGHIDPEMAFWTTSGEFIFITILAGTGSVVAPFAGALIYGVIHTTAYDLSPNTWQMSLGLALLLIIVFLPEGLWSMFRRRYARHP